MSATTTSLNVADAGAGEPVLLLHSAGLSGRQWRRLGAELVGRGMRAVAPDLTGHGGSPPWPEPTPFSFQTDVEQVGRIFAAVKPAHVIAHSYGGLIALHVAAAAPESVRSLTLFDPVGFGVLDAALDQDAREVLAQADMTWGSAAIEREHWLRSFVDFWGGKGAWSALREDARAEFRRVAWVVREGVRTLIEDTTPARAYGGFRFPLHLVTGEKSPLPARRVVARIGEAVPGSRVTVIGGVGHLAPVTHAESVNRVLVEELEPR